MVCSLMYEKRNNSKDNNNFFLKNLVVNNIFTNTLPSNCDLPDCLDLWKEKWDKKKFLKFEAFPYLILWGDCEKILYLDLWLWLQSHINYRA